VQIAALDEGKAYAFRENPRRRGTPVLKVKVVAKVGRGRKVKIRYEDGPHPGLEEYVDATKVIVPWGGRARFLKDEERMLRLEEHARQHRDPAIEEAVGTVLASSGEPSAGAGQGQVSMTAIELERIAQRAGLTEPPVRLHHLGFVDNNGDIHLPLDAAVRIARAFAAAEPETVLMYIDDYEQELKVRGYQPGDRYLHNVLRQYQPGWAIARQWAGFDQDVERLEKEITRLRGLVSRAAASLRETGNEQEAHRLLRALKGR
jgi:hypothetical protein